MTQAASQTPISSHLAIGAREHRKGKDLRGYLLLLVLGCLLYLPGLGSYQPIDPTDSFFIEAGREAVETNNYLVPLMNYKPWLDKPILYFWAVAGSIKLLGDSAFAGRIFGALCGIALGIVTFTYSKCFIARREALLASVILISSPLLSVVAHASLTDTPLTLLMTTAALALLHYDRSDSMRSWWVGFSALSLAFLCKGPIAIILVVAVMWIYWLIVLPNKVEILFKIFNMWPTKAIMFMTAVNLPWYLAATIGTNGAFFRDFFVTQNFGRMVGTVNHQQPFWFYIPVFFGGFMPWSLMMVAQAYRLPRIWKTCETRTHSHNFIMYCLVWAAFELLLFSAIKTKLPTYILPAAPPLAILAAICASTVMRNQHKPLARTVVILPLVMIATICGAIHWAATHDSYIAVMLQASHQTLIMGGAVAVPAIFLALVRKYSACFWTLAASISILCGGLVPQGYRAMYEHRQKPFDALLKEIAADGGRLATVVREEPSTSYRLHKRVPCIHSHEDAVSFIDSLGKDPGSIYILVPREVLDSAHSWFAPEYRLQQRSRAGRWVLYTVAKNQMDQSLPATAR